MGEATTNGFPINENRHSYSDAYVNKNETANGNAVHHVNGNDNEITTTFVSNGVLGIQNCAFRDG